jgi:hypothetical protein
MLFSIIALDYAKEEVSEIDLNDLLEDTRLNFSYFSEPLLNIFAKFYLALSYLFNKDCSFKRLGFLEKKLLFFEDC